MSAAGVPPTQFEPIAVVGRACLLPGASSPEQLWNAVVNGQDLVTSVPADRWGLSPDDALCAGPEDSDDRTWSDRGGYVRGFEDLFDPEGFGLAASEILALDPVFQWTFHTAREALRDAGHDKTAPDRFGAVFGNLSFPSASMAAYAQATSIAAVPGFGTQALEEAGIETPNARNRFTSGLPALLLERALGLGAGAFALDAACASSLYAIKLACDRLHDGDADLMLAGAVNCADDLCVHLGFSALTALSRTGQSRPFHSEADGLVPAEGCGFVALRRLDDAVRDGDTIHGIIRGVGLSNDGRGRGLLVPSSDGQTRAIERALEISGLTPSDISLLECHATGTQVGDATEISSSAAAYAGCGDLPIGSLKSNMGHLITAAGVGGLIKVLEAMRHEMRPPTLHADTPLEVIAESPFRLLEHAEPWDRTTTSDGVFRAGVSAFGFGGNNAHLIIEEPQAAPALSTGLPARSESPTAIPAPIAIVGIGVSAASALGRPAFAEALLANTPCLDATGRGVMPDISLPIANQKFPPNDLKKTLGQQLAMLQVTEEAIADSGPLPNMTTGVYVGMGTDLEAARFGTRWRIATLAKTWGCSEEWITAARDAIGPVLDAPGVLGTMPNIVANRINSQHDLSGPSFTVSSEERSGLDAIVLAARALRTGEIDAALVGAVDLSCDPVHSAASAQYLPASRQTPGDAAVMLVLKRLDDAERDGDQVYAVLPGGRYDEAKNQLDDRADLQFGLTEEATSVTHLFGHAHAASGLIHLTAAALALHHRTTLGDVPFFASNGGDGSGLPAGVGPRTAAVSGDAMDGIASTSVLLAEARDHLAPSRITPPRLYVFSAPTVDVLLHDLSGRHENQQLGPCRLVIVADSDAQFDERADRARRHIEDGHPPGVGVHFRKAPLEGEMAFVFTAAGAAYPDMGSDLLRALPELATPVSESFPLGKLASWAYGPSDHEPTPSDYLWGTSLLTQSHAQLTRHLLRLAPSAAIGYSSGESSSLYAFGVWSDMDAMRHEIESTKMMDAELGVEFTAIARAWGTESADWKMWNVLAPVDDVRHAIADEEFVHLAIINTAQDVVIGGDAASCGRVIERLGARRCRPVNYNLACHVPEVGAAFRQQWLDVHTRQVTPLDGVRHYSNGTNSAYRVSEAACAAAITRQAESTVDFPATITAAFDDGVRIFVEHGPAGACTNFINEILADHDILAVQLDRHGMGIGQIFEAVAALLAAGVDVDHVALSERLAQAESSATGSDELRLTFPAHPAPVSLPPRPSTADAENVTPTILPSNQMNAVQAGAVQTMAPAPVLPSVFGTATNGSAATPTAPVPVLTVTRAQAAPEHVVAGPLDELAATMHQQVAATAALHAEFVKQQSAVHEQFLTMRSHMVLGVTEAEPIAASPAVMPLPLVEPVPAVPPAPAPAPQPVVPTSPAPTPPAPTPPAPTPPAPTPPVLAPPTMALELEGVLAFAPEGPTWDREQLKIHSSGKISELFGPAFAAQDERLIQCRMPEPPLLLADRVTGLVAEPGVLGKGTIWTETDVAPDAFYLNNGFMPAGFMIESGQADLMLISYMGIDLVNDPGRSYRLLGCTLTYHGDLPSPGDTLEYEIRITGHAKHGDIRLFFFEYDCLVDGEPRLTVRDAQAGFFNAAELEDALGLLWTPEEGQADLDPDARVDPPLVACAKTSFTKDEVVAFSEGRTLEWLWTWLRVG